MHRTSSRYPPIFRKTTSNNSYGASLTNCEGLDLECSGQPGRQVVGFGIARRDSQIWDVDTGECRIELRDIGTGNYDLNYARRKRIISGSADSSILFCAWF